MDCFINAIKSQIEKLSKNQRIAFVSSLVAGIFSHGYAMGNNYIYHDATILNGLGTTFGIGRWALGYVGIINDAMLGNYHLPFLNIAISLLLIAISAMVVVGLLDTKSSFISIFVGAIFAVYPVVTSTFAYNFSATFYFLALLLSVLAVKHIVNGAKSYEQYVKLNIKGIKANLGELAYAVLLIAISAGFYQAYLSVTLTLLLTLIMIEFATSDDKVVDTIKKGVTYVITFGVGLIVYLVINNISVAIMKPPATGYQGAENMGSLSLAKIPGRFIQTYMHFFYIKWNGINKATCMWVFIVLFLVMATVCIVADLLVAKKEKIRVFWLLICLAVMPIAVNIVYLMSTDDNYSVHTLMRYATVFVFITPAILMEKMDSEGKLQSSLTMLSSLVLCVITFCYIYSNNVAYIKMNLVQEEMTSYFTVLESRICQTEGYNDDMPIVFSGEFQITDNNLTDITEVYPDTVILGYEYNARDLINKESWKNYMKYHAGFAPNIVQAPDELLQSEEFIYMPVYPDAYSIRVINGMVVVKLGQ